VFGKRPTSVGFSLEMQPALMVANTFTSQGNLATRAG